MKIDRHLVFMIGIDHIGNDTEIPITIDVKLGLEHREAYGSVPSYFYVREQFLDICVRPYVESDHEV